MRPGIVKNPVDVIANLPAVAGAGSFIVTDPRGIRTDGFVMTSATGWYAVDFVSGAIMQLPNPPAGLTFGAGVCAVWDATTPLIYVLGIGAGGGTDAWFSSYNPGTGVWAALNNATLNALLPGVISIDGALAHPCTAIAAAASDDFIYWTGGASAAASLICARYSIGGDTWVNVPPANRGVAAGAGATLDWLWGMSVDRLYSLDGGGVATAESYGIAGDGWAAMTFTPPLTAILPSTGTCACTSTDGQYLYFRANATGTIYRWDPRGPNPSLTPLGQLYGPDGVATVGSKMCAYEVGGVEHLVCVLNGSSQIQRIRLVK